MDVIKRFAELQVLFCCVACVLSQIATGAPPTLTSSTANTSQITDTNEDTLGLDGTAGPQDEAPTQGESPTSSGWTNSTPNPVTTFAGDTTTFFSPNASTDHHRHSDATAPFLSPTTPSLPPDSESSLIPIYLGAYFSMGGKWEGSGMLPACQMALDHINNQTDVLPGYELRMVWNDTRCEPGLGTRVFFHQLFRKPLKTMILGAPCSPTSQIMSGTAYHWNLIVVSPSSTSPGLSNREKYPLFYRTYMPDAMLNPARIRLMREFGWRRVATIHENHEVFSLAIDNMLTLLKEANITIISSESFSEDPKNQVANLKSQDAKIIIGNFYKTKARRVFCEAFKQGMTGSDYVWMLLGWYSDKWWLDEDQSITCSKLEMRKAVEGAQYISMEGLPISTSKEKTVAGITPAEFSRLYVERMALPENQGYTWNDLAPFEYDAAWAVALALNRSAEELKTKRFADGTSRRLEDFTYTDSEMAQLFFTMLNRTEFDGVSGPVAFREGDRVGITKIEQLQGSCADGWLLNGSTCFQLVPEPALSSAEAQAYCTAARPEATLAHADSEEQHQFLNNMSCPEHGASSPDKWLVTVSTDTDVSDGDEALQNGACVYLDCQNGGKLVVVDCGVSMPFICRVPADFSEKPIAFYGALDDTLEWRSDIIWPGGAVPLDRTPVVIIEVIREYQGVSHVMYFSIVGVATFCIITSLCFLAFNVKYRQQRYVKMSSPNLNNVIIIGAILVYVFVIVSGLDMNLVSEGAFGVLCHVKTWTLSVGFVLAFGAMFSKTWRVHRVAAFKTPKRRIVTDGQLFVMVFVLLVIDVFVLTLWQVIDPKQVESMDLYPQDDPEVPNRVIQPYIRYCTCGNLTYWLGALYAYKGLLLIFGTFLAWETRKVSIPGLNDSKLIGISVYNVIILCLIGVAISVVLDNNTEVLFIFVSCIILFCTSITLIVIFVPKIIAVVKFPEGDPSASRGIKTMTKTFASNNSSSVAVGQEIGQLRNTIQELEMQVKELERREKAGKFSGAGQGFGCWSCGMVCAFTPSRSKDYIAESNTTHDLRPVDVPPSGNDTATTANI